MAIRSPCWPCIWESPFDACLAEHCTPYYCSERYHCSDCEVRFICPYSPVCVCPRAPSWDRLVIDDGGDSL